MINSETQNSETLNSKTLNPKTLATRFPTDFIFGVATSAYQIEGATQEDGRKPSIWDAFCRMPGRVHQGHTGDIACDHYHRWESDLDLMSDLGVQAYRFSIAWPRIIPDGKGLINERGLDFYDRLLDGLKARNLKAFATLYHWDLPLMLMGDGGWTARSTAYAFQDYVRAVIARLGDRLDTVATFNEPWCSVILSHYLGIHAPGEKNLQAMLHAAHYTNLAHGLGVEAIRAEAPSLPVGIVYNPVAITPVSDSEADHAAAQRAEDFNNGLFFGPVFNGAYPESLLEHVGEFMPDIPEEDMTIISQKIDWWGLNYYSPARIENAPDTPYPSYQAGPALKPEKTDIGWEIDASAFIGVVRTLYQKYDLPEFYITENGACDNMEIDTGGTISDQMRIDYYSEHLTVAADIVQAGFPLRGYFAWSLMDNFEWAEGYKMRFGLVHVDYNTQQRTIKESGKWYQTLITAKAKQRAT